MNFADLFVRFVSRVEREHQGTRIVRSPSAGSGWTRILLAPAERIRDDIPEAQRERQRSAGARAPEAFGHDLFEFVEGGGAIVVRTWKGAIVPLPDEETALAFLQAFHDRRHPEGMRLRALAERIREGTAAAARDRHRLAG